MATEIPPSMRVVAPFVIKARQMEKADPVISYYCYVYVVQQALAKGLTKSPEGMTYTAFIMDTLEERKLDLADNEAVVDDMVGKIYVEEFANKIFGRAENAQNARSCTKQTAETFLAASAFFELLRVFGNELDAEISKKIVFAKYSASRILKALKAGEDPNPPIEELPEEVPEFTTDTEPSKPYEVSPVSPVSPHPPAPTVEEAVDDSTSVERAMARMSTADESLHPSRMMTPSGPPANPQMPPSFPSPPETQANQHPSAHLPGRQETMSMSTPEPFPTPPPQQQPSLAYFPPVGFNTHETSVPSNLNLPSTPATLPSAPVNVPRAPLSPPLAPPTLPSAPSFPPTSPPSGFAPAQTPSAPENFYAASPPPPAAPPINHLPSNTSYYYSPPPATSAPPPPPAQSFVQPTPQPSAYQRTPAPVPAPPIQQQQPQRRLINPDDEPEAVAKAQKHARWAVSALNYDDVATAVKELRLALQTLGAE